MYIMQEFEGRESVQAGRDIITNNHKGELETVIQYMINKRINIEARQYIQIALLLVLCSLFIFDIYAHQNMLVVQYEMQQDIKIIAHKIEVMKNK